MFCAENSLEGDFVLADKKTFFSGENVTVGPN